LSLLLLLSLLFFCFYPRLLFCLQTSELLLPPFPLLLLFLECGEGGVELLLLAARGCSRLWRSGLGLSSGLCLGFGGLRGLSGFGGGSGLLLRSLHRKC
jgi:hypothetical protein